MAHEKIKVSQFIENREPSAGREEFCSMKNVEEASILLLVEPPSLRRLYVVNLNPVLSTSIYPKLGGRTQQSLKPPKPAFVFSHFFGSEKKVQVSPSAITGEPGYVKCSYGLWLRIDQNYKQVPKYGPNLPHSIFLIHELR